MREHDGEPVRGLPERLPENERILWQGAPSWEALAQHGFHLRALVVYFAALIAWVLFTAVTRGDPPTEVAIAGGKFTALAFLALGLIALFSWLVARTTAYTITNCRVVMRFGIAMPMTVNIPFSQIASAGLRQHKDGSGDIPLHVPAGSQLSYFLLWPHARPWRLRRSEAMLRAVPDAATVALTLGRAVAARAPDTVLGAVSAPVPAERPLVAVAA